MNLLDLITGPATRKAQVSALATALVAVLTAILPNTNGHVAQVIGAALAVLAAFGITYQTPNKGSTDE